MLQAIKFAANAHKGQKRKDGYQFISHPVAVALALSNAGFQETVVIAGILHDTIEDTATTYEVIATAFGKEVADLVQSVSYDQDLPKEQGKELYLQHLTSAPQEACAISAADLLANRTDTLLALIANADWDKTSGSLEKTIAYDRRRLAVIRQTLRHSLVDQAEQVVNKVHQYLIS